ncbi:MAG: hypothetical protein GX610_20930 [Rhodococcus sp.]|nr:hypothetical protein [Rhodococcus sp. (in: high G+C Gram-positive bacteria)]
MNTPSVTELVASVIEAGSWSQLRIVDEVGTLSIVARRGTPLDPPVRFAFDSSELARYYRACAADAPSGRIPWQQWLILMPTHLDEALYRLDVIGGPAEIVIADTGFDAVPLRSPDH